MADKILNVRIQNKYDTEANWKAKDPVLLKGEQAFTSDGTNAGKHKIGDGTSKWSVLSYAKASLSKGDVTTALGYTPPTSDTWRGIQNNLTSDSTSDSLSAAQGKVLKGLVDGKAASGHTHDDRYYTESEMNTKLSGKSDTGHKHAISDVTNLQSTLDGKASSGHTHNYAGSSSAGGSANSAVKVDNHLYTEGFEFGYKFSKTIKIAKTTSVQTNYVLICSNADFRFKNFYVRTSGNNTNFSFKARIFANAYMTPNVDLETQIYNGPEIKNILIYKNGTSSFRHDIYLEVDSSTSVDKTIYVWADTDLTGTISTTAPTTKQELKVTILNDNYIYSSKNIIGNLIGNLNGTANYANSAGGVAWGNVSGKPSTFAPSSHTHNYLAIYGSRPADINFKTSTNGMGAMFHFVSTSSTKTGKPPADSNVLQMNWDNNGGWDTQFAISNGSSPHSYIRSQNNGTWGNWTTLLDSSNYNNYSPSKTGTGASGTWGINITGSSTSCTGNAATASNASKVNGHTVAVDVPSGAKFTDTVYSHPTYTAKSSGLYKVTVDGTGHISATTAVTKADITALGIPTQDTWRPLGTTADTACAGNDSRLSNARPASDVYAWAKASTKPSYSWSEITSKPSTYTPSSHTHAKSQITDFPSTMKNPTSIIIKLNGGPTEGTNMFTYDGSTAKSINITASSVGAATEAHTHTKSQITNFPASLKNPTSLSIQLNSGTATTYDGSATKSINITPSSIGAAASSHTHTAAQISGLPTWNSLKPSTTSFDGINLDNSGAYIYGQDNSGNIYFRYKEKPVETNYHYTDIASIASSCIRANNCVSKSGDTMTGELVSTSANAIRLVQGYYGWIIRNDGDNVYFMPTPSGEQYGGWMGGVYSTINLSTGQWTLASDIGAVGYPVLTSTSNTWRVVREQISGNNFRFDSADGTARYCTGTTSDIRFKKNLADTEITDALSVINSIKLRSFDWKETNEHQKIGFVADEIEKIDSKLAYGGGLTEDGKINSKVVDSFYLQGYIVKALQELSSQISILKKENIQLKSKLNM